MIDYLIDTNILIYISKGDPYILDYISSLKDVTLGISVITYIEFKIGLVDKLQDKDDILDKLLGIFEVIDLDANISNEVVKSLVELKVKNLKTGRMADLVIGHTANRLNIPLITNNSSDFKVIKGLKILEPF